MFNAIEGDDVFAYDCTDDAHIEEWFNRKDVRTSLHVDATAGDWKVCNSNIQYGDSYGSLFAYPTLLKAGIRVWTYTGDADADIPFNSTIDWIKTLRSDLG